MIDIIIPAYNCSKTLEETLNSLKEQTDKNFKVIIVDDCSTQNLKPIIEKFDLNITYIRNEKNVGCGMSRQVGIDNSTSDYFMFCDSDDIIMPNTVEKFNEIIKEKPEYVVGFFYRQINNKLYLEKYGYTWCHGKLYSREILKKYNITNKPQFSWWADDGYINFICHELCDIRFIQEPLYIWTETEGSITKIADKNLTNKNDKIFLKAMIEATKHVLKFKDKLRCLKNTFNAIKIKDIEDEEEIKLYNELAELKEQYG